MELIDARGLSCPEPVVMIKRAMDSKQDSYEMIVDNIAAKENVTRFAAHQGYQVEVETKDGEYVLHINK